MSIDFKLLGRRIKQIRTQQNLSQAALAEMIGCSSPFISYMENGSKTPSLEMLVNIANALCVTTDQLLAEHLQYNNQSAFLEYSEVLKGCTEYERRVILDTASQLKKTLKDNQTLFRNRQNKSRPQM